MCSFSVELVTQEAIVSPLEVYVKKGNVVILLRVNGEVYIPVKTIQIFNELLNLLLSVWAEDKCVIGIREPAQRFCGSLVLRPFLKVFRKEVSYTESERGIQRHNISLLVEFSI
jgi:hypothetical protein